jgi:hypothetical protein
MYRLVRGRILSGRVLAECLVDRMDDMDEVERWGQMFGFRIAPNLRADASRLAVEARPCERDFENSLQTVKEVMLDAHRSGLTFVGSLHF